MSIIIDLDIVCVICLKADQPKYRSVYEQDEQSQITIAEKISYCSDLHLHSECPKIPEQICESCYLDLSAAWRFKQYCDVANSLFESIQRQEDEEQAKATLELQQQDIKLPSCLKIKKILPKAKTVLLSVNGNDDIQVSNINNIHEEIVETTTEQQGKKNIANKDDDIIEDLEELDEDQYDFIDYYETEEVLDAEEEGQELISLQIDVKEGDVWESEGKLNSSDKKCKKPEEIQEEIVYESKHKRQIIKLNEPPSTELAKRGRGRPKKLIQIPLGQGKNLGENHEKENLKQDSITKFASYQKKCILRGPTQTRKRKSITTNEERPPKICEICGNSYKYQHALISHMRRHNNERPFACEFCDKGFVSAVELRRHMRVHTGHKPYGCQFCDRKFSDFGSRIKHERTHTGERPYECLTCGKSFAYAHVLSVHVRTHTGEKKYRCTLCGKGFTKKVYLIAHMNQHTVKIENSLLDDATQKQEISDSMGDDNPDIKNVLEEIETTEFLNDSSSMTEERQQKDKIKWEPENSSSGKCSKP